jgi:disulfide bond formation protein DsbB
MSKKYSLYGAWLLSCLALMGSLYFSEVHHLEPCHLCWYQRIFLYPLTIILGIATYRNFAGITLYALPLALFGLSIAAYQVAIQEVPSWQSIELCGSGPSCTDKVNIGLGPLSMPMLSVLAFSMISGLLISTANKKTSNKSFI